MLEALSRSARRLRESAYALPLAVVAAVVMLGFNELGYRQANDRLTELVALGQARLQVARLSRRIADAESSKRGYLLTTRDDYLLPYRDAIGDVNDSLQRLHRHAQASRDPVARSELAELEAHVQAKTSEMDEVLGLFNAGRKTAASELMLSGIGRDEMTSIRTISERMMQRQNELVAGGLSQVYGTLQLNRTGVATLTVLGLLVLALYLRQRRLADLARLAQQRQVQDERDRLEVEVQHRTAELTELARHLETAREDERARLARDLHDELGALLTAVKLDVARLRPRLAQAAPELAPRMAHLIEMLNSGIALKRRIIEDLRPSSLSNLGLLPALEMLCTEGAERLGVALQLRLEPVPMQPGTELTAYRLVQESLNNIGKHAGARHIEVVLEAQQGQACLRVTDDGVGFEVGAVGLGRHGLVGMRYRVQADGGRLEVRSAPGQGTTVQAWLPAAPDDRQRAGGAGAGRGAAGALDTPGASAHQ